MQYRLINYVLNDEKLELRDITIVDAQQDRLKTLWEQKRGTKLYLEPLCELQPQTAGLHNTYTLEQEMLRLVRRGDTAALRE